MVLHSSGFGMTSIEAEEVWANVFVDKSNAIICLLSGLVKNPRLGIFQGKEFVTNVEKFLLTNCWALDCPIILLYALLLLSSSIIPSTFKESPSFLAYLLMVRVTSVCPMIFLYSGLCSSSSLSKLVVTGRGALLLAV